MELFCWKIMMLALSCNVRYQKRNVGVENKEKNVNDLEKSRVSYVTEKGKIVVEGKIKVLVSCKLKCAERFQNTKRQVIFDEYWSLGSRDRRTLYLSSLVMVFGKQLQEVPINKEHNKHRQYSCKY